MLHNERKFDIVSIIKMDMNNMDESKNPDDKAAIPIKSISPKRPVDPQLVRQTFLHGLKAVVVEKVNRAAHSAPEDRFLSLIGIKHENRHLTIHDGRKYYKVDGFDPETNTIYEFDGDFWHGNPSLFKPDDINPRTKTTFGQLHEKTVARRQALETLGYTVVAIWEAELIDFIKEWENVCESVGFAGFSIQSPEHTFAVKDHLKDLLYLFSDEKSPSDNFSDEEWQNLLAYSEFQSRREAAREAKAEAKRLARRSKPPVDHEDAYWRHVNGSPYPTYSDDHKVWITENPKFEFQGVLWTRFTRPMKSNSGKTTMAWNPYYVSEDRHMVGEGPAPKNRRNDSRRDWGLPD